MGKYLPTGTREGLDLAESALGRALELNPDLPIAHKLLAQLEVDSGRAENAMSRLMLRAQIADPELLAGLVSTCRYCGLLDASVAAHVRAVSLEPRIRTSVPHTWFLRGDHAKVAAWKLAEVPYIGPLSLAEIGRKTEALTALRELEQTTRTRVRDLISAALALLEGRTADSVAAINRILASDFRDPEGLFYTCRHLAHLHEDAQALDLLERVIAGGFFCYPAMAQDPWLNPLRKKPAFTKLLKQAETRHREAEAAFVRLHGDRVLGAN
jgi:tetratricopeptide (TPR) repeat protein